jgi:SAM-dependent methyltransferase
MKIKKASISDFPLYDNDDPTWHNSFKKVMEDSFIKRKYNRDKRLSDKISYIDTIAPEIKKGGYVIDIGPGPGEFLEVCRYYGNNIKGIDSSLEDNLMSMEYLELSRLMTSRQEIPIHYVGLDIFLKEKLPWDDKTVSFINSQGSIEQALSKHIIGNMRDWDYRNVFWTFDEKMHNDFERLFKEVHRILKKNGIFLIVGNGTGNTDKYSSFILDKAKKFGFNQYQIPFPFSNYANRVHKMIKV